MTKNTAPIEGLCMKCRRRTALFLFSCAHLRPWSVGSHTLWLCSHDWSAAKLIDESPEGSFVCQELPISVDPTDFDPFQPPIRTELDKALAYGPIAGPITGYSPKDA